MSARSIECGALRVAEPGDNHDGGTPHGGLFYAGCHLDASHVEGPDPTPHDFSELPDAEHAEPVSVREIEASAPTHGETWKAYVNRHARAGFYVGSITEPNRADDARWNVDDSMWEAPRRFTGRLAGVEENGSG